MENGRGVGARKIKSEGLSKFLKREVKWENKKIVWIQFDIFFYNTCPQSARAAVVISQHNVRHIKKCDSLPC